MHPSHVPHPPPHINSAASAAAAAAAAAHGSGNACCAVAAKQCYRMPLGRDASAVATYSHDLSLSNAALLLRHERSFPHRRKMVEAAVFFIIGAFRMQFLLPRFLLVPIPLLFLIICL